MISSPLLSSASQAVDNLGGYTLVEELPTKQYLVRFLVPNTAGGSVGKYSECQNADLDTAIQTAAAGLNLTVTPTP